MQQYNLTKEGDVTKGNGALYEALKQLPDGRWTVTIAKAKKKRSLPQNAYYHGIIINEVKQGLIDMGFESHLLDHDTIHEMLKAKFLKKEIYNEHGEFVEIVQSTSNLSTTEFMDYIADIQMWAATFLNIVIIDPGQQSEIF